MKQPISEMVKLAAPQAVDATAVRVWTPDGPVRDVVVVLAHAAGSGLDEHVIATLAAGLSRRGIVTPDGALVGRRRADAVRSRRPRPRVPRRRARRGAT